MGPCDMYGHTDTEGLRSTHPSSNRKPPWRNRNGQDSHAPDLRVRNQVTTTAHHRAWFDRRRKHRLSPRLSEGILGSETWAVLPTWKPDSWVPLRVGQERGGWESQPRSVLPARVSPRALLRIPGDC